MNDFMFAETLKNWYKQHARDLPWRRTRNPYHIWLSEIILQQTRVNQGLPYYMRFIETFPDVFALAHADEVQVLRLWQGLGYYSRARNLHTTAKQVAFELGGVFPHKFENLLKLKGIGKYTAAAIASFSFDEREAVVDGNVYRVLARYFGITDDISSHAGKKTFENLAYSLLPEQGVDTYNQAVMEFGAIQCVPVSPACLVCPLQTGCSAFSTGQQANLPMKLGKVKVKTRYFYYFVIYNEQNIWMRERKKQDIWKGLYDFFVIEQDHEVPDEDLLNESLPVQADDFVITDISGFHKHVLTHQIIFAKFISLKVKVANDLSAHDLEAFDADAVKQLPKPILIHNYLTNSFF